MTKPPMFAENVVYCEVNPGGIPLPSRYPPSYSVREMVDAIELELEVPDVPSLAKVPDDVLEPD